MIKPYCFFDVRFVVVSISSSLGSGLIGIEHDKNLNFGIEGQQVHIRS